MNTYVNYIYLIICEVSLEMFKKTNFVTYSNYCKEMGNSLKNQNLSLQDRRTFMAIYEKLDPIFSLDTDESAKYIAQFFELDSSRINLFERIVRNTNELFPTSQC